MRLEGENLPYGSTRNYDVCVIGSGAAGITLARELSQSNLKVAVLEAGGLEWDEATQNIYQAAAITTTPAKVFETDFSTWSRLRYFGGSTNHWGGWCRPFEAIDFEKREWVPNSGWPITRADLIPYYARAYPYVELTPFNLEEEENRTAVAGVTTREFHYSPPTRFGELYREELFTAPTVDVILNASAVRLDMYESGVLSRVLVKNFKTQFFVNAHVFILACGGMENARLLLNSDHQQAAGLANSSGTVGRYFMEHPHATIGALINTDDNRWFAPFVPENDNDPMRILTLSPELQRSQRLMNYSCQLDRRQKLDIDTDAATGLAEFAYGKLRSKARFKLYVRSEMQPNPNNRIELTHETDELGLRRFRLHVNFNAEDLRSVVQGTEAVIRSLSAQALGRGAITLERDDLWSKDLGPGCHHMGTTRMSDDRSTGVVDRNCLTHDIPNLYVAGSSVFATASFANPTLTIVALALRLADHVRERLERDV